MLIIYVSGVDFTLRTVDRESLEDEIRFANQDESVDGMMGLEILTVNPEYG